MLLELLVENYAVVERVRVRFHAGLNLLTGETGSGKSIVVDALGLVLGARASAEMVRSDTERARVSAIFEAPRDKACLGLLDEAGCNGRGWRAADRARGAGRREVARVSGKPPGDGALCCGSWRRSWAISMGSTSSSSFFRAQRSCSCWTISRGWTSSASEAGELFRRWKRVEGELEELNRSEQEKLRMADLWSFQRKEIEAAALKPGEDAQLENERLVLRNVAKLQENASAAYAALYDAPESVSAQLRTALKKLEELARIDREL